MLARHAGALAADPKHNTPPCASHRNSTCLPPPTSFLSGHDLMIPVSRSLSPIVRPRHRSCQLVESHPVVLSTPSRAGTSVQRDALTFGTQIATGLLSDGGRSLRTSKQRERGEVPPFHPGRGPSPWQYRYSNASAKMHRMPRRRGVAGAASDTMMRQYPGCKQPKIC